MTIPVPTTSSFPPYLVTTDVSISSGGTASGFFDTNGMCIVAVKMPAAWTAASIGFESNADAVTTSTVKPVYDIDQATATLYTVPATTSGHHPVKAMESLGVRYARLISGNSTTTVAQGGARTITVVLRYF